MPLTEQELAPGDVIFFKNKYYDKERTDYIDHVAMFAGFCEHTAAPLIIHSIISSRGHYYPQHVSGLCLTTLRALTQQLQEDGAFYDVCFEVFRCNEPQIAQKALSILKTQVSYRIPYDEVRLDAKLKLEEDHEDQDFKKMSEANYYPAGLYRSIKYAARHPFPLTRTRGDGIGKGLTCSMTVILAFQIAELLLANKIKSANPEHNEWPSDKYGLDNQTLPFYSPNYQHYLHSLQKNNIVSSLPREGLKTGLHFWNGTTSPEDFCHKTFALDAKLAGAAGMYCHMAESNHWIFSGELAVVERYFSEIDKAEHKKKLLFAYQDFLNIIEEKVNSAPILCSPSPSPLPLTPRSLATEKKRWWEQNLIKDAIEQLHFKDITSLDINVLHSSLIDNALQELIVQHTKNIAIKDVATLLGLLLNNYEIEHYVNVVNIDAYPFFEQEKKCTLTVLDIDQHLQCVKKEPKKLTFVFYPDTKNTISSYTFFVQKLFNVFVEHLSVMDGCSLTLLMSELLHRGMKHAQQNKTNDALALYLMAQVVYCSKGADILFVEHKEMKKLFDLRVNAFTKLEGQNSSLSEIERKKMAVWLSCLNSTLSDESINILKTYHADDDIKSISNPHYFFQTIDYDENRHSAEGGRSVYDKQKVF